MIAHHLSHQQVLERLCEQVRFARRRFGHDEVIDFLAVLFGYAIGTAPHGGGQFGQLSHSLESMGDSPSPSLEYIWSSPFSPFQTARIVLALHGFVFLLVICLLLSLARLWRLCWFHLRPSSSRGRAKRTTLHRLLKPRCPDDGPACRLASPASSGGGPADVASLARGEKPARSPQAREHRGLRLSQPELPLLRHQR